MKKEVNEFLAREEKRNVRLIKDKFGKDIVLINEPSFAEKYAWRDIAIIDAETLEQIGKVQYSFSSATNSRHMNLHNIKVYDEADLGRGIGSYALRFLEEVCYNSFCNTIEGKYYPEAPATGDQVKKFYARNGYLDTNGEPYREGYELNIYKYLVKEDIILITNNTTLNEQGYKVYGNIKYMSLNIALKEDLEA